MIRKETVRHRHKNRLLVTYTFEEWAKNAEEIVGFKMETGFIAKRYISSECLDVSILSGDLPGDVLIHPFQDGHLNLMYDYDLQVTGYERQRFLHLNFNEPNSKTLVALKNGRCVGYGIIKLSCPGAKRVGPLYADDSKIAEALLKSLIEEFKEGRGVVIVIPSSNLEAQMLIDKLTIPSNQAIHFDAPIQALYQIYEKGFPEANVNKVYAVFDVNGTSI